MNCLNPIYIPNKSRFFDSSTKHPLIIRGRCGKCANCQQNKSAEWYFRALKEFEHCVKNHGYVQFVTLSYSEQYVPRLSYYEEFSSLNRNEDMYCFMSEDLVHFHSVLRSRLRRLGFPSDAYGYFIASEYGHDNLYRDNRGRLRRGTSRPHYHCMFYVNKDIDPLVFSAEVQKSWYYGLTDGIGSSPCNKPVDYVLNNTFYSIAVGSRKVVNYVTKYVQKSMSYSKKIDIRIKKVLNRLSHGDPLYFKSEAGRILKRRLYNLSRQFHRQSQQFGLSGLDGVDFTELYQRGYFLERGQDGQFLRFPISQYYHRRICYDKVWFDGSYMWSLKESALPLIKLRNENIKKNLINYYKIVLPQIGSAVSPSSLADYVLNYKGRNLAPFDESPLLGDRLDSADRFVYSTYSSTVVTDTYLGNERGRVGVVRSFDSMIVPLSKYLEFNVISQSSYPRFASYDVLLDSIRCYECEKDSSQSVYETKQTLVNNLKANLLF